MQTQTSDTTENGAPRLAAIEQRYELAKRRIADVAVPRSDRSVHDTVAVDVRLTRALVQLPTHPPQQGGRSWRSLRMPRWIGRSLSAS